MTRPLIVARARPPHSQARKRSSQGEAVPSPCTSYPSHHHILSHLMTGSYTLHVSCNRFGSGVHACRAADAVEAPSGG